jgi:hypothetical protein
VGRWPDVWLAWLLIGIRPNALGVELDVFWVGLRMDVFQSDYGISVFVAPFKVKIFTLMDIVGIKSNRCQRATKKVGLRKRRRGQNEGTCSAFLGVREYLRPSQDRRDFGVDAVLRGQRRPQGHFFRVFFESLHVERFSYAAL